MKFAAAVFGALVAFAALASVNITHHADADFFAYDKAGPIGSGWSEDVPSAYIPGGVDPSNAVSRLTDAETRHAFVGAFDAFFHRFMASHAFGTAETSDYVAGGNWTTRAYKIRDKDDWKTDETTMPLFDTHLGAVLTNGWAYATNRVYAVTNITVAVTNWAGWTTNVVRLPSGKVKVSVGNRYEVTQAQIPDTSRILYRYKDGHDYVRGVKSVELPRNPNGLSYLLGFRTDDHTALPEDPDFGAYIYRWPRRDQIDTFERVIRPVTNIVHGVPLLTYITNHWQQVSWPQKANIGWSWSQVANYADVPNSVDPFSFGNGGAWVEKLSELVDEDAWGWIYPTTWDIWGRSHSRQRVSASVWSLGEYGNMESDGLLQYQWICEDDWEDTIRFIERNPLEVSGGDLVTNHVVSVITNWWSGVVETNEYDLVQPASHGTVGYAMLTNLVELCPATTKWTYTATNIVATAAGVATNVEVVVVSNFLDRVHIVPDVETFSRINWTEWAGTDGFLALTDTALIGPEAMPVLRYDSVRTNAAVTVDYATPAAERPSLVLHGYGMIEYGEPLGWFWSVTGSVFNAQRSGQGAVGGAGDTIIADAHRYEAAVIGDAGMTAGCNYAPGEVRYDSGEWDAGVGRNCVLPSNREHVEMLSRLAVNYENDGRPLAVGDVVYFDYRWDPAGKPSEFGLSWVWGWVLAGRVSEYSVDIPFVAGTLVDEFPGDMYVEADTVEVHAHCNVGVASTAWNPNRFIYNFNKSTYTNSIPCSYPNPNFAGDNKVDKVEEIKATALLAIASTTNCFNSGGGDWGWDYQWDTNGYRFASSADSLATARDVDAFFAARDFDLNEKLREMVAFETGITPTTNMNAIAAQVAAQVDASVLEDYGGAVCDWINETVNAEGGETNVDFTVSTFYDPALVKITGITPTADYGDPWNPQLWFEVSYQVVRPQIATNSQGILYYEWTPTDEKLRRCWAGSFSVQGITNEFIKVGGMAAAGRVTGMEAVKWNFDTMKARGVNP